MIKLEDWMSKPVITIDPDKTVMQGIKFMKQHDIGALVMVDAKKKPIGILTERDILRLVSEGKDLVKLKIQEVMTKGVKSVDVDATVLEVSKIMHTHGFRRIVITKNGQLVGIMTDKNLIELMSG
ncbi:MAG: CBS domain-containing protein [archaeon]